MAQPIKDVITEMIQPFLDQEGFELVDVEYVKEGSNRFLRVYVDKEGGIDIDRLVHQTPGIIEAHPHTGTHDMLV